MARNLQVTLAARPAGEPKESDFALVEAEVPGPGEGEVVVRNLWLSLDPYMRGRMNEARSYVAPVALGEVMGAQAVGEVVESRSPRYAEGDVVVGMFGWQEYAAAPAHQLRRLDPAVAPVSTALHVLGMTGLTAYFGLFSVGSATAGDTVVVSAASGAVGQVAGQLAKIAGCRAVGIAGSPEKIDDCLTLFGYDAALDYKRDDLREGLKRECPDGVDVYFDNVGGPVSAAVHRRLALRSRIAICGQIAEYNQVPPEGGPRSVSFMIAKRVRMEGFLVNDFARQHEPALMRLAGWLREGRLRYREDVVEGLEHAPRAFIGLLNGENRGKLLVKVAG
ncbi:MAG TPA: NADP-dependent oxidoreductase [Gaiellaceae bacterium]|jgi:NADPH-dependent curcumin reductase CurA|nr:NADP-dependent oxidoreductase [Gaiellaceae bacterium]